ncbi:MAG: class I SAM-dependent methyltransferase [bacterium]|nr:class I SAM-dependent methyltransferase [bacterium]
MKIRSQVYPHSYYDLMHCSTCTHIFLGLMPTQEELRVFYSRNYKPYNVARSQRGWRAKLRERVHRWIYGPGSQTSRVALAFRWILPNYPTYVPKGVLLDVGCGAGTILQELSALGWQCEGIDVEPTIREKLAAHNILVHVGDALDILRQCPPEHYDAVLSCHSLEHLASPLDVVKEIARVLRPGGQFVVTVPNHDSWLAKRYKDKWFALECPAHIHIFSIQSLTYLLTTCGLKVTRIFCSEIASTLCHLRSGQPSSNLCAELLPVFAEVRARFANFFLKGDVVTVHAEK